MSKKPKIEFDAKGLPVVYGDNDQPVNPDSRTIEEIIGKGKVVKVENITVMQVKGSCDSVPSWLDGHAETDNGNGRLRG